MAGKIRGVCKLIIALVVLWTMIYHICPTIIREIPAFSEYAAKAEENNIHTGALFYNDVAQAAEGELYIRNAIRFTPQRAHAGE